VPETAEFQDERAELKSLLKSGIFHRAPHLVRFLSYVCERYFEGQSAEIKEYTIAVEALGRGTAFDPKKDSIVRVEAHRLRKRLGEYYAADGANHAIHIVIPNGQYVPQFVVCNQTVQIRDVPKPPIEELAVIQVAPALPPLVVPPSSKWRRLLPVLALCGLTAVALWRVARLGPKHVPLTPSSEIWAGSYTDPVPAEFRMLAGYHGPPFTDRQGHTWNADAYFTGGYSAAIAPDTRIEGQPDPRLLKAQRSGTFHYDIPLGKGTYELHLYFAETEYGPGNPKGGGEASRVFQISINGTPKLAPFDPLAESGAPNRFHERVLKDISPAADGRLHIAFAPLTAAGFLNGLEILSSTPGRIRPVRIVAQDRPVTDAEGHIWSADEHVFGGTLVLRRNTVEARDKALYRGERYGHFEYHIPLAPGKYRLTLHFAETWFGSPESGEPGLGSRVFNVFANGVALLQNFEIANHGGLNREVTTVFENLQPNAQGVLLLEFVPIRNYAEVNAIEVIETE
jgi:hypothetical protein